MNDVELDDGDIILANKVETICREVIRTIYSLPPDSAVVKATFALLVHVANCFTSIYRLVNNNDLASRSSIMNPAAGISRGLYENALLIDYIATGDPSLRLNSNDLGQMYLDFEFIEQLRLIENTKRCKGDFAKRILESPLRNVGEVSLQSKIDQVGEKYRTRDGKYRTHWYHGSIADIATKLGRFDEYIFLVATNHSSVHGGTKAVLQGPPTTGPSLLLAAGVATLRSVSIAKSVSGITVSAETTSVLCESNQSIIDL